MYKLDKPFTNIERADFICEHQGMTPYEDETAFYFLEANEIVVEGEIIVDPDYNDKLAQARQEQFNKDFFNTSLGYVRRKVTTKDGTVKDFLTDYLANITIMFNAGQQVPILTYSLPDFTREITPEYMETLQNRVIVTSQFIQDCALQVSIDFYGEQVAQPNNLDYEESEEI